MSGFPIFTLPSANLEKVISKVKPKSYFRLQQTCRGVMEFIQTSKNISMNLDRFINAQYVILNHTRSGLACIVMWEPDLPISLETLYGCRLNTFQALAFTVEEEGSFEDLRTTLKKYRIAANMITGYPHSWTGDQSIELARLLKPHYMNLESVGCQAYREVVNHKSLKDVLLRVDPFNVIDAAVTLLPHLTSLHMMLPLITVGHVLRLSKDELLDLLPRVFTLIFSNQYPNLQNFQFHPDFEGNLTMDEIAEHFRGLDLKIKKSQKGSQTEFLLKKRYLRDKFYCSITCSNARCRVYVIYNIFGNFIH